MDTQRRLLLLAQALQRAQKAPALLSNAPITAITAEGDGAVLIRLSQPHNALAAQLAHYSTLVLAPESYGADGKVQRIIGTGPYRIRKLVPPQQVETEAFEGHDRPASTPAPAIRNVAYLAASRAETRALMVEGGQAHLAYGLDPASLRRLKRHAKVGIASVTLPRTVIVKVNAGWPALADVRVRRALSLSIDRAGIAKALLRDPELAATQIFPPTLGNWHDASLTPLAYDPDAAARLLTEAGWRRAPDGLRDRDGQPLRLSIRTFVDRPELPHLTNSVMLQDMVIDLSDGLTVPFALVAGLSWAVASSSPVITAG